MIPSLALFIWRLQRKRVFNLYMLIIMLDCLIQIPCYCLRELLLWPFLVSSSLQTANYNGLYLNFSCGEFYGYQIPFSMQFSDEVHILWTFSNVISLTIHFVFSNLFRSVLLLCSSSPAKQIACICNDQCCQRLRSCFYS